MDKIIIDKIERTDLEHIELPDDRILSKEYCMKERENQRERGVREWDPLDYAMWKLRLKRVKMPSFLVSSMYENATQEYREKFGEITVPIKEEYDKEDWIALFNECLRNGISVEAYLESYCEEDGIPFGLGVHPTLCISRLRLKR